MRWDELSADDKAKWEQIGQNLGMSGQEAWIDHGGLPAAPPPPPPFEVAAGLAAAREKPLLGALEELRLAGVPTARRKAFTPFAQRGFGASGLAKRGVREALGIREAKFARERERIRADVLARAVQETLAAEEIRALKEA